MRNIPLKQSNWIVAAFVLSLFLLSNSCKKIDIAAKTDTDAQLAEAFLQLPGNAAPELKRIAEKLKELHQKAGFLSTIGKQDGLPVWNKAIVTSHQKQNSRKNARTNTPGDTIVYIPLVIPNEKEVNAFIYARLNGSIHLDLFNSASYAGYGFGKITDTSNNAEKLAVQFMILNNIVFDYNDFKILDNHLFKGSTHSNEKDKSVHISHISSNGSIAQRGNGVEFWEYDVCTSHKYLDCSSDNRCCPDGSCSACKQECWKDSEPVCEKVTVIVFSLDDDPGPASGEGGTGGGGGLGGTPAGGPAACNPTPSLDNGLPPCPRGGSDGWEPSMEVSPESNFENWDLSPEDLLSIEGWKAPWNIDTTRLDSCRKILFAKLRRSLNVNDPFGRILVKLERAVSDKNNLEKFKIKFKIAPLSQNGNLAYTDSQYYYTSTGIFTANITLDSAMVQTSTDLLLVQCLMHEIIHAYMSSILLRIKTNATLAQIKSMSKPEIFNEYIDSLKARKTNLSGIINDPQYQHNYMVNKLIEMWANVLAEFDNHSIPDERYYWYMTFVGLQNTKMLRYHWPNYPNFPPSNPSPSEDSTRGMKYALTTARLDSIYYKVYVNERNATPDAKGKKPIQGGCYQ